jgi:3',5'-cyclic AMP phosphodiesterase CpdA
VTARILHVSDLHVGQRDAPEPIEALRELAVRLEPEVVVATGDLAHRGRRSQLEAARGMLESLGLPVLAVPGNHDLPYTLARFTRPFDLWTRSVGPVEPSHISERVAVLGLNSARPWRQQGGALEAAQLERLASRGSTAPGGALRVVALHHQLAAPPWRTRRKRPLSRRDTVLHELAASGVELVVSGHVHQASVAERREFEVVDGGAPRALVLASAAGLGRPRPRRRGEAVGCNVYEWDPSSITVVTHAWAGGAFSEVARRVFSRL